MLGPDAAGMCAVFSLQRTGSRRGLEGHWDSGKARADKRSVMPHARTSWKEKPWTEDYFCWNVVSPGRPGGALSNKRPEIYNYPDNRYYPYIRV